MAKPVRLAEAKPQPFELSPVQLDLVPHPASPPSEPFALWVNVDYAGAFGEMATVNLWYSVKAPLSRFAIPGTTLAQRRDRLWQSTCFELFVQPEGEPDYAEFNFAPSGEWAAYDFDDYRAGMVALDIGEPPYIRLEDNLTWWTLGATVAIPAGRQWRAGLSAVIEQADGTKSYWALAHNGEKPDFHDPACFTARLG
jgi:hypothetical protein